MVKLLPKSENAIAVQDFRPISLMNTDAKIFAHVVCDRIQKDPCKVVKNHQHAYFPENKCTQQYENGKKRLLQNDCLAEVHVL